MSKKTIGLITTLLVITVLLIVVAVSPSTKKQNGPLSTALKTSPTQTPEKYTVLQVAPNPVVLSSSSGNVDVRIDTNVGGSNNVTAVQLEMAYDIDMLSNVSVKPGTFFTNPVVLLNKVDPAKGTISYWVGIQPGGAAQNGQGVVATVSFTSLLKNSETTDISFTENTKVAGEGKTASVLQNAAGGQIRRALASQSAPAQNTTSPTQ